MLTYSDKIKEIRKVSGLSVPKLAERINIPARTIVSYETGRTPSLDFLTQLCNEMNVNANWFISGKGEMFINEQNKIDLNKIDKTEFKKMFMECMKETGFI